MRAELLVVRRDLDLLQDPLGGDDLVGAHDQQHSVGGQHAVARQDVEQGVLGEERLREARQVVDRLVGGVCPPRRELEGVAGLATALRAAVLAEVLAACGVGVVLRQRAVADHEELDVLEEARAGPEAVALIASRSG